MYRRRASVGLALLAVAGLLAMSAGCHCPSCAGGCGDASTHGHVVGGPSACDQRNDRYAPRVYHHKKVCCHAALRDPRTPGPRVVSTLPAEPEMEAPGYFHPVPTYPVFGPRSEMSDGIEPQMQPLLPGDAPGLDGEPLPIPMPRDRGDGDEEAAEEPTLGDEPSALKLSAPGQSVRQTGWKPAKRQAAQTEAPTRPCAKCSISFRQPSSSRR